MVKKEKLERKVKWVRVDQKDLKEFKGPKVQKENRGQLVLLVKEVPEEKKVIPALRANRDPKATKEIRVIKAIKDKLVQLVLWVLKAPEENRAYPVKTELLVKLDLKAPLVRKVRVEKKEKKVIEDLLALKVLLDQEARLAQLDKQEKMVKHQ